MGKGGGVTDGRHQILGQNNGQEREKERKAKKEGKYRRLPGTDSKEERKNKNIIASD